MKPEWAWHGDSEHEGGIATYTVGGELHSLMLPTFMVAAKIASLIYRAYRGGVVDGIEQACVRVDDALQALDGEASNE